MPLKSDTEVDYAILGFAIKWFILEELYLRLKENIVVSIYIVLLLVVSWVRRV